MARPTRARRAAAGPAPTSTDDGGGEPAPAPLRKRSHADALGHDGSDLPATATDATEPQQRRSKRGKTAARGGAGELDSLQGSLEAAPHAAPATSNPPSQPDTSTNSSTLAASSDVGTDAAAASAPDHRPTDMALDPEDDSKARALDGLSAQDRRALKGKGRATEDEDEIMADRAPSADLTALQRELAARDELIATQTAILASLHTALTCNVCLERLDRPYALQCGHVFCRGCLINWFFRPRTDGEEEAGGGDAEGNASDSASSVNLSEPGSRARAARTAVANASTSTAPSAAREPSESAEDREQRRRVEADLWGDLPAASTSTAAAGSSSIATVAHASPAVPADEQAELSADALRRARLARFDSRRRDGVPPNISVEPDSAALVAPVESSTAPVSSERAAAPPPGFAPLPAVDTTTPAVSTSAAVPAPPLFPARVPTGEHRAQNLVCPQCRASCAARAPHRIFALDEVLSTLMRTRVNEHGTRPGSASPVKMQQAPLAKGKGKADDSAEAMVMDEKDKTWSGLFPGEGGGTESSRDRRRRLAQVVRDREDGVRRCGHCNWELDERTGICEGCGRQWDISSDDSDDDDSDGGAGGGLFFPFRRGFLGRQHHDLDHSSGSEDESEDRSSSARGEDIGPGRGRESNEDDSDSYESDFVVKSDDDDDDAAAGTGRGGPSRWRARGRRSSVEETSSEDGSDGRDRSAAARRRGRRSASSSSDDSIKWTRRRSPAAGASSSDDDDDDDKARNDAKRKRRFQGEVIDPDSESGSGSGSGSEGSDSEESSSASSPESEDAPRTTRSGRRIAASAAVSGRNVDIRGFETSSGDDDFASPDSRDSGGSGITDDDDASSAEEESASRTRARPPVAASSSTRKKKRVIAISSDAESDDE